jgi:cytochrome c-type biogenesis protein CcmH/NrfG
MQDSYPNIASESASIKIAKTRAVPPVNATLLQAYQAYLIQSDVEAQRLYKRVLQQDIRNIDALLGMGAIAERQVRVADAIGWFQKVLEVDPKNAVALSALVNLTPEVENKEQQLKGLLAKQPDNAALHVDLASIYAEDQRWVDAQQAYFEAFRLNPTPENAFNLAVSLDQLHKPKLALTYYQQALALAQSVPNHSVDIPLLEARMRAIEAN